MSHIYFECPCLTGITNDGKHIGFFLFCSCRTQTGQNNNKTNLYMVVPYHQGLSERIKRTCNKFEVQVFLKGGQTIRSLLMAPKEKHPITNKSGVIYRYKCSEHGCNEEYIGESARNFAERFKEHQKPPPLYLTTVKPQVTISTSTISL